MPSEIIRTLIVDDEPLARKKILTFLAEEQDVEICAECANGLEAVDAIRTYNPDLIFLDIQMPEMDGFEVIRSFESTALPCVIFITAYDQYAIQAFENHALDYLLKPFNRERFKTALNRARDILHNKQLQNVNEQMLRLLTQLENPKKYTDRIVIKSSQRIFFLPVSEIDWLGAAGNYVEIHSGKETHLIRDTLSHLETTLDSHHFIRIHRSAMVNIDRIQEIQPDSSDYLIILKSGHKISMSRNYKEKFVKIIGYF